MELYGRSHGTGLIEALIATTVMATALVTMAGLASLALRTVVNGRNRSLAAIHAQAKLELLLASRTSVPATPGDALDRDVAGCNEYLDAEGRAAGVDAGHAGTVFVRRWLVAPVPNRPGLQVIIVAVGRCAAGPGGSLACVSPATSVRAAGVRSEAAW